MNRLLGYALCKDTSVNSKVYQLHGDFDTTHPNVGALIIGIGLGVHYAITISIIGNPQNSILIIIKAPTLDLETTPSWGSGMAVAIRPRGPCTAATHKPTELGLFPS